MKEMHEKVLMYVANCWDNYRCSDKDKVNRIIDEVISDNPEETDFTRLGMIAKRRCMMEE